MKKTKKAIKAVKRAISKIIDKVKFVNVVLLANKTLVIELVKIYSDNSTKSEKHILTKDVIRRLLECKTQKQFASIVNDEFVAKAQLDAQAKKQMLTKNTYYCNSRNYIALALGRLQFAEVAFKNRHATEKAVSSLKAKKEAKAKKTATAKN